MDEGGKLTEEFPRYILECRWDEETNGEVEEPICDGRESHACGTCFEGPHFCGVDYEWVEC